MPTRAIKTAFLVLLLVLISSGSALAAGKRCGNGVLDQRREQCDDANRSNNDACLNSCKSASCGDGYVYFGVEECDDANTSNADSCLNNCKKATCGDGLVHSGVEECDDSNGVNTDGCTNTCKLPVCGDALCSDSESCSSCSADCGACPPPPPPDPFCGDGTCNGGETCSSCALDCSPCLPGYWTPPLRTSWQIQFTGLPVDISVDAEMFDIDLFDNDKTVVDRIHAQGDHAICYINTGAWEDWRPDAGDFPESVKGNPLDGWPGERWLDIRQTSVLDIMKRRMDLCKSKGFDGVDIDNVDGYTQNTDFPLTYQDQINYNTSLANAAHERNLSISLKNDLDQIPDLLSHFDFAMNEECYDYNECNLLDPFVAQGKAVFVIEYKPTTAELCPVMDQHQFNGIKKNLSLDAYREACPSPFPASSE